MAYVIDASSLIEAKNRYYDFEFCPGFWEWLQHKNSEGRVFSIDRILRELEKGSDELADWVKKQGDAFFHPVDARTITEYGRIRAWVAAWRRQSDGEPFKQMAIDTFFNGADPFLVAYCLAHQHTVVTAEKSVDERSLKVKIPTVCKAFGVPCVNVFDLLKAERARFVLG